MNEIVTPGEQDVKREFHVAADETGLVEVRVSNDVPFTLQVYLGVGGFIAGQLRNADTGEPPTLPEFLRDLADMVEKAQVMAANDETPPEPEAA